MYGPAQLRPSGKKRPTQFLPPGASPKGQLYYAAAVVDAGVIVTGVYESKEDCDNFVSDVLMAKLPTIEGGLEGEPQEFNGETLRIERW